MTQRRAPWVLPTPVCRAPSVLQSGSGLGALWAPRLGWRAASTSPSHTGQPLLSTCCRDGGPAPAPASEGAWDLGSVPRWPPSPHRGEPAPASRRRRGLLCLLCRRLQTFPVPSSGRALPGAFAQSTCEHTDVLRRAVVSGRGQLLSTAAGVAAGAPGVLPLSLRPRSAGRLRLSGDARRLRASFPDILTHVFCIFSQSRPYGAVASTVQDTLPPRRLRVSW